MDRLSLVAALALALALACGDDAKPAAGEGRSRVNAVQARAGDRTTPAEMCDVLKPAASAPAFTWPPLAGEPPAVAAGHWRWVNVWATWCAPCVEELPRLRDWQSRLTRAGAKVSLALVSADESDEVIEGFRAKHPALGDTARVADPEALAPWLEQLGVAGAALPVHVFVDPQGRVRCVRASAVDEPDYDAVETLIR